jgi:hypothetical protein
VEDNTGRSVIRALVPAQQLQYVLPGAMIAATGGQVRWRVWALDGSGKLLRRTPWRSLRGATAP